MDAGMLIETQGERIRTLEAQLAEIRDKLQEIVCTVEPDAGVVMLSSDGPTHREPGLKWPIYDHEYFSPLGDALIELYILAGGEVGRMRTDSTG